MKKNKFIVIGAGTLGAHIAATMSKSGHDVIIIDAIEDSFRRLDDSFSGYNIVGDATDLSVLEKADIKKAQSVVLTTDNDNVNIYLSHVCFYIYNVPKIFVRLSDIEKGKLLEGTTIKAIYPFNLSFNEFIELNDKEEEVWK